MATGLDAQQTIFASNPDDRRAFEALEEHFFLEGDWAALAELYRARIDAPGVTTDPGQQAPLLFRLGQIEEERLLDLDGASRTYWTLVRLDPANRPALRQLRGIHARRGQWDVVIQIAELESATEMPPFERAAFEAELGRTWHVHLQDREEARLAYERALAVDPEFPPALQGLAELHREAGRLREAAHLLELLTDRLRGPERAPAWIALGTLLAGPLEERDRARRCFAAALEDDPFQSPAVEWSLLLATEAEDWPLVSELLECRFDLASGARSRAAIAVEASQIQLNHLGSVAGARAWIDRALELSSDEPAVLLACADVERAEGDREGLLESLDRLIVRGGRVTPRSALLEAAELHADFGHDARALETIRRAAERSGADDERVLLLHARLLRAHGDKAALAEVLETLSGLDGADPETRAAQLRELATLQEEDLADETAALGSWRRAFDLAPGPGAALDALDRLHRKRDDWSGLRDVLEIALEAAPAAAGDALGVRLGHLILDHFDDPGRARDLFEAALARDEESPEALAGLRRLADTSDDPDLLLLVCEREARGLRDAERMGSLVASVHPILEARGELETALAWAKRWTECPEPPRDAWRLRADLEQSLDRPEAEVESRRALARRQVGRERSETLLRQATLHERLDQPDERASALERALESGADQPETLAALCDVYRRLDRPRDLVRALRQLADRLPPADQADPLEELATTLQDPLGDLDTAIVVRWRLVELPDAPVEAPGKLEALLELAGRHEELAHLLLIRRQRLGDDGDEAFELDLRRGRLLLDSLGHSADAAEIFGALHARHPESDEILNLYERALRESDDAAGLSELLARRIEWAPNDESRAALKLERARLHEENLGEPELACDLYAALLADHPEAPSADEADQRLEFLLESTGQWKRLKEHLSARAERLPDVQEATLRETLAALCGDRLNDVPGCAEQLERVAAIAPERVHVWRQLERIYRGPLDRPADWLRVVEAELEAGVDADRELGLRTAAARLCLDAERRPADRDERLAYEHYERVLALRPGHAEATEVLALHFEATDRPERAAEVLAARLDRIAGQAPTEAAELRLRLANLYADVIGDDERARPLFEQALAAEGPSPEIVDPLARILERGGDHAALAELARQVLARGDVGEAELAWRLRSGSSEQALGHLDEAALAFRAALVVAPDDRTIEDALIEIYERLDEVEPLTELLEKRLAWAVGDEAIDLRLRLARLHADARDEPGEALRHLEWILEALPQHRDAFRRAIELAERIDEPARVAALLDRALDQTLPDDERADLLERRAELYAGPLDRPEQAVLAYREAVSLDRTRASTRAGLRAQLERLGRWPAVLDCLFVAASEAPEAERRRLYEEAAEIAWSQIGPDASLPWLTRLAELDPGDPEIPGRIAEVHRRAGRFEAALGALDREIALRSDPSERCALHARRARLLERELHSPARAIEAYRTALVHSREPDEILLELDRLLALMGRPSERAEILARRIEHASEGERIELRRTLASLYCVELARPELAIAPLEANVEAIEASDASDGPERMAALGALDAALRAAGRLDDWTRVAERELTLVETDHRVAETTPPDFVRYLREELARTWDQLLGDTDRALVHLRALCVDPDVATGPIGERLRALLRRTGRRRELAERLAALDAAGAARPEDQLELGQLLEEAMLDLPGARAAYQRAQADPALALPAIRGRRRICERLADWAGLADALADEFALEGRLERSERGALARRLGEVAWSRLGAPARAIEAYGEALALDPGDLLALRARVPIHEAAGEIEAVVTLLRKELECLPRDEANAPRRKALFARLGQLLADRLEAPEEAIAAFGEAAAIDRLDAADEKRLAELHGAVGDDRAFALTFGRWCDREDAGATVHDHLFLAHALHALGDAEAAAARCERATAVDPENADAWAFRATLAGDAGELEAAALAWSRAADHAPPALAAGYCVSAARCLGGDDDRAGELLARAIALDPAHLPAQVECTRIAARQSRDVDVLLHAERALELERHDRMEDADRLEIALLAARAARRLNDLASTQRHFAIALEVEPDHLEALEGLGLARAEDGDPQAAREPLERRLGLNEAPERPAPLLTIVAEGLELDGLLDAAWTRFEEALAADPSYSPAHAGLVRVHERAGRIEEALAALESWSGSAGDVSERASAAFRAAEHALALERPETALEHLEFATGSDPGQSEAWALLCELAADHGSETELRALCERALDALPEGPLAAPVALRAARAAEIDGDLPRARERYAQAARWNPRGVEAALCASRLARQAGDWADADAVLARFLDAHPDPDSPTLAHVQLERGRLLSGPLEDFDGAVAAYEAALRLGPDLAVARSALASLLVHSPERWREAVGLHREILEAQPATARSLRAIAEIAERRERREVAEAARTLLQALGLASPEEQSEIPAAIRFPIHPGPPMADAMAERLRRIAHSLGDELRAVLASTVEALPETGDPALDAAIRQIAAIEDELAAPGLARLMPEERSELFLALAGLFLDPGGNGGDARFRGALEQAIGRWTRRKVRRIVEGTTLEAIGEVDPLAWGDELRAMAAAHAIDRDGQPIERVLKALLVLDPETAESPAFEGASLATLASGCEPARRLLRRIVRQLCERLEQNV